MISRLGVRLSVTIGLLAGALALSPQTGASAQQVHAGGGPTAKPGTNLLLNPNGTATGKPGRPIRVGEAPRAIVITPDGRTAYAVNWLSGTVTSISTATDHALPPIPVGAFPFAAAFAPDRATLYVANFGANTVTPVNTRTDLPGRSIPASYAPDALAATASGVYVVGGNSDEVTRLGARAAIRVGYYPAAVAITG